MKRIRSNILGSFVWLIVLMTMLFLLVFNIAIRGNIEGFIRNEIKRSVAQANDLLSIRLGLGNNSHLSEKYQVIIHDFMRISRQTADVEILILGSNGKVLFPATFEGSKISDPIAEAAFLSTQDSEGIVRFNIDNETFLATYMEFYIDDNTFIPLLFIGVLSSALQIISIVNITLIIMLATVSLIEILVSFRLSERISKPITAVADAALKISQGEFTTVTIDRSSLESFELTTSLNEMSKHLQIQLQQISDLSMRDSLTGLFNKRCMSEMLSREIIRVSRNNLDLAVFMIDVDHFKTINDKHGHLAGDLVLTRVAEIICNSIRRSDIACRFGGDEFLIILPECTKEDAFEKALTIKQAVMNSSVNFEGKSIKGITLSIGISTMSESGPNGSDLITAADRALYEAKQNGRNLIH